MLTTTAITTPQLKNRTVSTVLAFALLPLSGFATDIYIPSLPSMGADMHISSIQVQLTLTLFLISYGVSQLFLGSILDSYGRYKFSLGALMVFISPVWLLPLNTIFMLFMPCVSSTVLQ